MPDGNVAFKCTYNDGGDRGFVGFAGTCSNGNIIRNVRAGRVWCSHADNPCRQYYEGDFQDERPVHPCYESKIVTQWRYGPGMFHAGTWAGEPIPMKSAREGKVVLLTTRHPDYDEESQRVVFGAFKIVEISEDDDGRIWVEGEPDSAIRLPEAAALALPYWRFKTYPRNDEPTWRSGLFRYVSDQEVSNFLHALHPFLQTAQDRMANEELQACCEDLPRDTTVENADVEIPGEGSRRNAVQAERATDIDSSKSSLRTIAKG